MAAANNPNPLSSPQAMTKARGIGLLLRIQDEAKLQNILDKLASENKITADQSSRIQSVWEKIHETKGGRFVAVVLAMKDQAKFETVVSKLEQAGKITADQAAKIEAAWQKIHSGS